MEREGVDVRMGGNFENEIVIEIDMIQAEKTRDMIDAMTKTQLEYQATAGKTFRIRTRWAARGR